MQMAHYIHVFNILYRLWFGFPCIRYKINIFKRVKMLLSKNADFLEYLTGT